MKNKIHVPNHQGVIKWFCAPTPGLCSYPGTPLSWPPVPMISSSRYDVMFQSYVKKSERVDYTFTRISVYSVYIYMCVCEHPHFQTCFRHTQTSSDLKNSKNIKRALPVCGSLSLPAAHCTRTNVTRSINNWPNVAQTSPDFTAPIHCRAVGDLQLS